jgi:Omp85 superfamily domain
MPGRPEFLDARIRVRRGTMLFACVLMGAVICARTAWALPPPGSVAVRPKAAAPPTLDPTETPDGEAGQPAGRRITPLFAPVPFKNSQVGWGLAVMVGAIHRFDADTTIKPSTGAVTGFYTENHSWGLMAMEMARLAHDTWRLRGLVSHVDVRYDFFGIGEDAGNAGISVPLEQKLDFAVGSGLRRVVPGLYAGAALLWMKATVGLHGDLPPELPPIDADREATNLFAPGLQGEYDTRDDDYWPTHGSLASLKGWFFSDGLGSSRSFQRYTAAWSWYVPMPRERWVLATNVNAGTAAGDAPFYMLPSIGAGQYGLRGYTQGRYRDEVMTTVQAELRMHTAGRFGATVFGGFGQVAPSFGDLTDVSVLSAGGLGVRFQLTEEFPMHLRLDYAWGKTENLFYFSVAEAF